ncbi:hypothetical protein NPIL_12041 [Nephila pilipes]|uniref:Uncharacterized protein n=1 Tax=Nephila pilipes TaxID=299642 RepID=A0A8X6UP30_NEPPI|nr:hypothetical protein NPIL_12041 [Nephila pilipes]
MPCQRARQSTRLMSFEKEGERLGREGVSAIRAATSVMDGTEKRCPAFSPTYTVFFALWGLAHPVPGKSFACSFLADSRTRWEVGLQHLVKLIVMGSER